MTNRIELFLQGGAWMALHHGERAYEVQCLFGTPILPTAFTAGARPETVRRRIQELNPDAVVSFR